MTEEQTMDMLSDPSFKRKIKNKLARYFGNDFDVDVQFENDGFEVTLKDKRKLGRRTKIYREDDGWEFKTVKEYVATTFFQFGENSEPEDFESPEDFLDSLEYVLNLNKIYEDE